MKYFLFLILSGGMVSCGETLEGLENLNSPPLINFSDRQNVTVLRDSIKLSPYIGLKGDPVYYPVELKVFDVNDNLSSVEYNQLFGRGVLIQDFDTIRGNNIVLNSENLKFQYYPVDLGYHQLLITANDRFGKSSSAIIELEAFDNLSPVAEYTFSRDGQYGRRHWVFDASESYDRDAKYGGRITAYEFHNGMGRLDIIEVPLEPAGVNYEPWKYHVIFPDDNIYTVGVRVRDNDGRWSALVSRSVTVE